MKKLKDPELLSNIKIFLTVYLPEIRAKSSNTVKAYRDSLNLFFLFLKEQKGLSIFQVVKEDFNAG